MATSTTRMTTAPMATALRMVPPRSPLSGAASAFSSVVCGLEFVAGGSGGLASVMPKAYAPAGQTVAPPGRGIFLSPR